MYVDSVVNKAQLLVSGASSCNVSKSAKDLSSLFNLWIYAKCEKISEWLYEELEKEEDQEWFCRECKTLMMRSVEEALKLRKVIDEMKKDNDEIRQELSGLKTQSEVALVQMKRYEEKEEGGENNQIEKGRTLRRTGKELIIMWKRCR